MKLKDALKIFGAGAVGSAILASFLLLGGGEEESYEFLVRLEDKVNTQVFCLNPEHKDRVVYNDSTFEAPCPECGSDKFLYRVNNAITKKGHFITFKPEGWSWGTNERKHYGIIKIECTYEQAQALCAGIKGDKFTERPRKYNFDFETALTPEQLSEWRDKKTFNSVVAVSKLAELSEIGD